MKPWNDMYSNDTAPPASTFLQTYYIMDNIKSTLDDDLVKTGYAVQWNDSLFTIDELSDIVPSVSTVTVRVIFMRLSFSMVLNVRWC